MKNKEDIKYISNLKDGDFVAFATFWSQELFKKEYVNRPQVYDELYQYTLFCNRSKDHYHEEADMLVFKDTYCARGRHSGAYEFTDIWVSYVYQNLPEELKEKYLKKCESNLHPSQLTKLHEARDLINQMRADDEKEQAQQETEKE